MEQQWKLWALSASSLQGIWSRLPLPGCAGRG